MAISFVDAASILAGNASTVTEIANPKTILIRFSAMADPPDMGTFPELMLLGPYRPIV
jgi:hypothetical protein